MYTFVCRGIVSVKYIQGIMDSKKKRACNLVPIKIQIEAKDSNQNCIYKLHVWN